MTFGEQVIMVLETKARRWRYWSRIWDSAMWMDERKVKVIFSWNKRLIEDEYNLALFDFLTG